MTKTASTSGTAPTESRLKVMWERLADELARGNSASLLTWLRASSNLRHYSSQNRILIIMERPNTTAVMSEKAWKACGRVLRPDAKPVMIYAPRIGRRKESEGEDSAAQENGPETSRRTPVHFGQIGVYAEEDTEGQPLPRQFTPMIGADIEAVNKLSELCPFEVHWDAHELPYHDAADQTIHIPGGKDQAEDIYHILTAWASAELERRNPDALTLPDTRRAEAVLCAYALTEALGLPSLKLSTELLQVHWGGKARKLRRMTVRADDTVQALLEILMPLAPKEEHAA